MTALTVKDLNPALGAEVTGLEPNQPLDEETIRVLRDLFDKRGALVFRNLDIDETFQRYLVYTLIGEVPPATAGPDVDGEPPPSFFVSNREEAGGAPYGRLLYHCDAMWAEHPQPVISLYGVEVEQPSVPTMFINMGYGWDTLPERSPDKRRGPPGSSWFRPQLSQPGRRRKRHRLLLRRASLDGNSGRPSPSAHRSDTALCLAAGHHRDPRAEPGGQRRDARSPIRSSLQLARGAPPRMAGR